MLERLLELLVAASWVYWLVAVWMVRSYFRHCSSPAGSGGELSDPKGSYTPPVSVLKPVRGLDHEAYENFESYCRQDYPDYEIIFGVDDPRDQAVPVIRNLQRAYPGLRIRLVVADVFAANRKACVLDRLAAEARHEILVISDSDMRSTPDYLRRVVAPMADTRVGLVTCPYVGGSAHSLSARLEALHMGVTFLPSVVVARRVVAMRFAMGASNTVRRLDLERIGGFAALADYLAEDFQLGARIAGLGLKVHLSDYIMTSVLGETTFEEEWHREVRWSRCTRVSRPKEYPGLLISFSTPLAGILAWLTGPGGAHEEALLVSLVLRWVVAWLVTGYTHDRESRRSLFWLPARDVLSSLVWAAGGVGRRIVWRGEEYRLESGGRMAPVGPLPEPGKAFGLGYEELEEEEPGGLEVGGEDAGLPAAPFLWHP